MSAQLELLPTQEQLRDQALMEERYDDRGLEESDRELVQAELDNLVQQLFERGDYARA